MTMYTIDAVLMSIHQPDKQGLICLDKVPVLDKVQSEYSLYGPNNVQNMIRSG